MLISLCTIVIRMQHTTVAIIFDIAIYMRLSQFRFCLLDVRDTGRMCLQ